MLRQWSSLESRDHWRRRMVSLVLDKVGFSSAPVAKERAEKKVVIADGAEWIWNIADDHFPGAIQIVDLLHARQHLWDVARKLYPGQEAEQKRRMAIHQDELAG